MCRLASRWGAAVLILISAGARGAGLGESVAVIYNRNSSESKALALYYAERREVPASQVFDFDLPASETMTRREFRENLEAPLLKNLEEHGLWVFATDLQPATHERPGQVLRRLVAGRIRYAYERAFARPPGGSISRSASENERSAPS